MAAADPAVARRSDLPVRAASAVVMVAVAGTAFWLGGWFLAAFIVAVGLGIFVEWMMLVGVFEKRLAARGLWLVAGLGYIGIASFTALVLATTSFLAVVVAAVIAVDIGAYFAGRSFGGPRIAPAISPSKTWSGLGGGIVAAIVLYQAFAFIIYRDAQADMNGYLDRISFALIWTAIRHTWPNVLAMGALTAIIAQSGDFFESWMKRRAGAKDSGKSIPGHGGLFDRADGHVAVFFALGISGIFVDLMHV